MYWQLVIIYKCSPIEAKAVVPLGTSAPANGALGAWDITWRPGA